MVERLIEANGVELCTEAFGDADDPAVLLVMGLGASMIWWDERFCRMLADGGRFVIRYDHRDTGRSSTAPSGRPTYTGGDLVADAVGVLDAYGVASAHIVGVSAGGAFAQVLALTDPGRVRSLVLISTSRATPGGAGLPPPTEEFRRFVSTAEVDWSSHDSVLEYLVGYARVLNGVERPFDEEACRAFVRRDLERSRDVAALQNHDLVAHDAPSLEPLSSIAAPVLVVHGTADPLFHVRHGEALADEIPGASLLRLESAGHGVDPWNPTDWQCIVTAVLDHTRSA
jgi:pimeloyl-ACP methyl ester carboxylesterase